jgi:hypothetical protein
MGIRKRSVETIAKCLVEYLYSTGLPRFGSYDIVNSVGKPNLMTTYLYFVHSSCWLAKDTMRVLIRRELIN